MSTDDVSMPEPTHVGVAVVVDRRRILVGRRPLSATLGGYSEFPGGRVEEGESYEEAVKRECEEEVGIHVTVGRELDVAWQRYEHGDIEIHFFHCELIGFSIPRKPFEWVPVERLTAYRFPPANSEVLKKIRRMLDV